MVGLLWAATALGFMFSGLTGADEETKTTKTERGGILAQTDRHQFEVFFYPTGARVFPSTRAGAPVETSILSGTASFYHPNSPNLWFSRALHPMAGAGGSQGSLDLAVGLEHAPATGARVTFELSGLPDASESTARFTVPLEFVSAPHPTRPVAPQGGTSAGPRYTYGPGYYGYGYYERTSPAPSNPRAAGSSVYSVPSRSYSPGESVGGRHRDWTVGRDNPIAKPWLRPMD
jgi:hypothetical protein